LQALVSRIFQDRIASQRQQEDRLQAGGESEQTACIYCNLADTIAALGASTRHGAALTAAAAAATCQYKDQLESLLIEHQHVLSRLAVRTLNGRSPDTFALFHEQSCNRTRSN
jgi:hypothetical protein